MHDIRWIRENPEKFDEGLKRRFLAPEAASLLALDAKRRAVLTRLQELQARRNEASKEIGKAKASGDEALAEKLIEEVAGLRDEVQKGEEEAKKLEKELHEALAEIPNLPAGDVPVGPDETANVEREDHRFGAPPTFDFAAKQHFELGEASGLMDFETAAKLSGARFVVLKGALARLERALAQFMLDLQTGEHGYTEINPPLMVRDEVMFGTAQLPKFAEDQFQTTNRPNLFGMLDKNVQEEQAKLNQIVEGLKQDRDIDEVDRELQRLAPRLKRAIEQTSFEILQKNRFWLIPTAEVPLTNLVRESILEEAELPLRFTAFTPCFRAEAGAAGKDTRGMIRQHQFEKVELVSITTPEEAEDEHERMLACAEEVLKRLDLPFRVMTLATGDMGFAATKTWDIEVWLPGQGTYREISSCSNCGEFQARRMNARYRPEGDKQLRFVHTLNGSGLAVGRTLVAVLENHQQADGSVTIPEALLPYMGGITRIGGGAGQGEGA
jgi:seryl-tRNA synthetase